MAYPFLPVTPSCETVVVNDVCGCSSVVTNSGCNNNDPCSTTITASSTIVYNGPPTLSCIIAEPCDTLNVILQKIDEIICNLLSQINILNIQVNNITNQIININNEIVDINNTLDGCCTIVTTTSTSTTIIPTTTTSSTSTSSTTTSTTTVYPYTCTCVNVVVSQIDIDDATGNTIDPTNNGRVYISANTEAGCEGNDIQISWIDQAFENLCVKTSEVGSLQLFYYKNNNPIYFPNIASTYDILYINCSLDGDCVPA